MPKYCSAPRCANSNKNGYCLTTLPDDERREAWITASGITDWKPTKTAALCEENAEEKLLVIYKEMEGQLNNIKEDNEILKERVHRLQDDLVHIKSFGFHIMH
ncbi:hypothetical protein DMN91_009784 [Ooceraea biroi]|uniref:THAP-type domain-containing protein n=1 Tax=Ooceraea biroi TaxID=2015173 RepID=A0A3L8DCA9_OOCBI|nr:uncharacterized protein LOC105279419 isoform X2 [Ooceraea biroi]RLU17548.1 hypothetical protein DMN91_009784 [Ooceraea biroi]